MNRRSLVIGTIVAGLVAGGSQLMVKNAFANDKAGAKTGDEKNGCGKNGCEGKDGKCSDKDGCKDKKHKHGKKHDKKHAEMHHDDAATENHK